MPRNGGRSSREGYRFDLRSAGSITNEAPRLWRSASFWGLSGSLLLLNLPEPLSYFIASATFFFPSILYTTVTFASF